MSSTKLGGMEEYLLEIVRVCRDRGYRTVIQYESVPASAPYLAALRTLDAEVAICRTHTGGVSAYRSALRLLLCERPTVIQTHFAPVWVMGLAGLVGPIGGARKVVSMVHNKIDHHQYGRARYGYNRCDHVLAVSKAVAENLIASGVDHRLVETHYMGLPAIPNRNDALGIALRKELSIPADAIVFGSIGFDAAFKGVDVLLAAFRDVYQRLPNAYLLQVGVEESSQLRILATELGIGDRVRWAGVRDSGYRLLNAANIYVQPSRFGEGLPLSIMEAMALELPVIASRVSGNQEAVLDSKTGVLVAADDPQSLSNEMMNMALNRHAWSTVGGAGRARTQSLFNGRTSVRLLVDRYYDL